MSNSTEQCLYDLAAIDGALEATAREINRAYSDLERPLLALALMKGALVTTGALLPKLTMALELDYVHATRYRDNSATNTLDWRYTPTCDLRGRDILLIDDILDEGMTLQAVTQYCADAGARSVKSMVLVRKERAHAPVIEADFVALRVPDCYVFGFGMDDSELERNRPGIYARR